jgi:1,2-diacylglycerol 3-alpha-glucosyltransferase
VQLCIIFYNLGGYHLARLNAAHLACVQRGWNFAAIQIAATTAEHPWGKVALPDYVTTILPFQEGRDPALQDASLLIKCLDQLNPDVVVIPGWGFDFARAALKWCRRQRRVSLLMSESKYDDAPRAWWKELAKRLLSVRHFAAALVGGEKHRNYLNRLGMPHDRIFTGYDVVDNPYFMGEVDRLRSHTRESDVPECVRGRKYFIAVNRFIPRKNLAALIAAFQRYAESRPAEDEWDLVLLGDGSQKPELLRLAQQCGLAQRIHFPGFQSYAEICHWYAFASVFIHPALAEQWGLVVNEAMASGLPILLSKECGCYPDLMREAESGFSFDPTDVAELAEKMTALAEDSSLRHRMGIASREHIQQNFGPEKFGEGLLAAVDVAFRVPA